jgi:hypothetical protein
VALDELRGDRYTAECWDFASRAIASERARTALVLATRVVDSVATALSDYPLARDTLRLGASGPSRFMTPGRPYQCEERPVVAIEMPLLRSHSRYGRTPHK